MHSMKIKNQFYDEKELLYFFVKMFLYSSKRNLFLLHYTDKNYTVKPVLSSHSKVDKTKVLKPCGTLMHGKSTREHSAILLTWINRYTVKVSKGAKIRNRYNQVPHLLFCLLLSDRLRQILLYQK